MYVNVFVCNSFFLCVKTIVCKRVCAVKNICVKSHLCVTRRMFVCISMLVCKIVCLNSSSCVSFVSSFFSFSFNFFICTYFSQQTAPCLIIFSHHRIFHYVSIFTFHATRSSYLYLSLCFSTLSDHPSSSFTHINPQTPMPMASDSGPKHPLPQLRQRGGLEDLGLSLLYLNES